MIARPAPVSGRRLLLVLAAWPLTAAAVGGLTILLLRILAFVLPLYLVVQTCAAFVRHRRERAAVVAGVGVGRV